MSIIKKIAGYCVFLALALSGLIFVFLEVFLAYSTITDHKPAETESLVIVKTSLPDTIPVGKLSLYTWNTVYCG